MDPERWQQIKEIIDAALELEPAARAAYLAKVCSEPEMRKEVESLLASHGQAGDLFDTPLLAREAETSPAGRRIGVYEIVEEIGRGGMGMVYRAVRADRQFRQQVAIKLVKRGMDDDFILRRFRHERQILASLEHPNIARLLDGGSTEDGLPYFVMEYIKGTPIDKYCDTHRLPTVERLRLFRTVCSAVHYAHQKLIIHRDIKPGNILITKEGVPKLVDFGIAKILNPELATGAIDPTVTVLRLMTPEYASPEQVRGDPITAATDVYSLGVLLYELLTGHRPYRLKSRAPHELALAICEEEPEKPSTAIRRVEEVTRPDGDGCVTIDPESVSRARSSRPDKLRRRLAGDLDRIVLTAMRKEPGRRYQSVQEFSEDIRRHLEGLPVSARRDALVYRAGKLLQRHRNPLITTAISLAVILTAVLWLRSGRPSPPPAAQVRLIPFTSFPGDESQPAFSPDGKKIAFVWGGENNDNQDVYVKPLGGSDLLRLTTNAAADNSPTWSPDGRFIAFLRSSPKETAIFISPSQNGVHRKLADVYPTRIEAVGRPLDWSPDGNFVAVGDREVPEQPFSIYLVAVSDGSKRKLTNPPGNSGGDSNPAFSPDGKYLSFIRAPSSGITDIYVAPVAGGEPRRLTSDNRDILSLAWTPDGSGIVYSSNRTGNYNLWRIPASGGTPERLLGLGLNVSDPSFSRDRRRMAYSQFLLDTNIWRYDLRGTEAAGPPRQLILSTQYDSSPQYSPDGRRIAFRSSRSGNNEIWTCDSDGRKATQLTRFGGPLTGTPRWSPDGRWIAFDSRPEAQADIYVISSEGGSARRLTTEPSEDVVPSWSRDGRWIFFSSNRSGAWQVWKIPAAGGATVQVTQQGGFAAFESPGGRTLYYAKGRSVAGLWKVAPDGGEETQVLDRLKPGYWGHWAVADSGIYFADQEIQTGRAAIYFFHFGTGRVTQVGPVAKRLIPGDSAFAISPGGNRILYTQIDQSGSDILLAENPNSSW